MNSHPRVHSLSEHGLLARSLHFLTQRSTGLFDGDETWQAAAAARVSTTKASARTGRFYRSKVTNSTPSVSPSRRAVSRHSARSNGGKNVSASGSRCTSVRRILVASGSATA